MQMQGGFDATKIEPKQSAGTNHPVGRFPFTISDTSIEENKEKTGGFFMVEFTTPAGTAVMRYNMWNKSEQAVSIAQGQLSALCRAVGRFQVRWEDQGASLRGAQGMIEVGFQKGQEPSAERPNGGYTEVKKVLDSAGNDPAGGNSSAPQTQQQPQNNQQQQPMTDQGGGNWGNKNQPQNNNNNPPQGQQQQSWNNNQPQQNSPPQNNSGGNWQQGQQNNGGGNNTSPPWGNR